MVLCYNGKWHTINIGECSSTLYLELITAFPLCGRMRFRIDVWLPQTYVRQSPHLLHVGEH